MQSARKPWWQQATAIVSLGAGGAVTGLSFVPRASAEVKSPSNMLIRLLAQEKPAQPAPADDATLRSAIVNVANYYLRMAVGKTPTEMEAMIWQHDSVDGVDHGESCAAFASLTLELAAQAVGQQSWVTGGTSYPWPLQEWADVRVDPNPASLGITSVLQDAQAHRRWHPLGDSYEPLPGDWVLFNGHVEVVTQFSGGVLHTIGGDSLPNLTVNAHEFSAPLSAQGVVGFVNNGELAGPASKPPPSPGHVSGGHRARGQADHAEQKQTPIPGAPSAVSPQAGQARAADDAAIPGMPGPAASPSASPAASSAARPSASPAASPAARPSASPDKRSVRRQAAPRAATLGESAIPGLPSTAPSPSTAPATPAPQASPAARPAPATPPTAAAAPSATPTTSAAPSAAPHRGDQPSAPAAPVQEIGPQQAFISEIAPGAVATQHRYGVPASVTMAQAIDESAWGQSGLATRDHNLFGIKGSGPAGSDPQPTQEFENGQSVTRTALFRVYHNAAESIDDHGKLLATSGYYRRAMADRQDPNAFAAALTGVYATDPDYGAKLIGLMQQYDLYRYDNVAPTAAARAAKPGATAAAPRARKSGAAPAASRPAKPGGARSGGARSAAARPGGAAIPGLPAAAPIAAASTPPAAPSPTSTPGPSGRTDAYRTSSAGMTATETMFARRAPTRGSHPAPTLAGSTPRTTRAARTARTGTALYQQQVPPAVRNAFNTTARARLMGEEPLYRDVAAHRDIRWELLAACDWMQCEARPRYSPVHGEKLCTVNPNGTVYRTKSEALEQCADDLAELAWEVYRIDLTAGGNLSVRDLASAFAAFRWGGLLKLHHTSAMEFPYSVAGLTDRHVSMRWPNIAEPNTPDKPGGRFRMPFGAVPVVLGLNYPATV